MTFFIRLILKTWRLLTRVEHRRPSPPTFDAAVEAFLEELASDPGTENAFRSTEEVDAARSVRYTLGLVVRATYGLWRPSPLRSELRRAGLWHPCDMADLIITTAHRRLNHIRPRVSDRVDELRRARSAMGDLEGELNAKHPPRSIRYRGVEDLWPREGA
jgi:hypothetical protein